MPAHSKRRPIVEAGLALVHRDGFARTGVAAIAAAGGAPKGSFYNHFASKDAFGVELLDRYFDDVRDALATTVADTARPPVERIRAYFELLGELGERDAYARGCLIGNLSAEAAPASPEIRVHLGALFDAWTLAIGEAVADGQAAGSIRADVPAATLAGLLVDAWQGALLRAKVRRDGAPLDAVLAVLVPALLAPAAP
jgi:TetR/AcrR family transcriptional repressor of nem operon